MQGTFDRSAKAFRRSSTTVTSVPGHDCIIKTSRRRNSSIVGDSAYIQDALLTCGYDSKWFDDCCRELKNQLMVSESPQPDTYKNSEDKKLSRMKFSERVDIETYNKEVNFSRPCPDEGELLSFQRLVRLERLSSFPAVRRMTHPHAGTFIPYYFHSVLFSVPTINEGDLQLLVHTISQDCKA